MTTKPELFIVESLTFDDEKDGRFEGQILTEILRLCGKNPLYYYIRTKRELRIVLEFFERSGYRYLHLSCHGNSESIATTLDLIRFDELGSLLNPYLDGCRLFISACEAVNDQLARELIPQSGCLSIIGPHEEVTFDEAATMWASFYQLMFRQNSKGMSRENIEPILKGLVGLFEVPVAYYGASSVSSRGYRGQVLVP